MQIVSGGTDNHLLVVKLLDRDYSGKALARALEGAGIITSMSTVPGRDAPASGDQRRALRDASGHHPRRH